MRLAIAVLLALLSWACAFPAIRLALSALGPVELSAARTAVAAVPAVMLLLLRRPPLPPRRSWWRLAFLGLVFIVGYSVLLNLGETTMTAGTAAFIVNFNVVITAVLSATLLRDRLGVRTWAGTFVSLLGVLILVRGESGDLSLNLGALYILGAAVAYAASTIVQKPLLNDMDPLQVSCVTIVLGAAALLPWLPDAVLQMRAAPGSIVLAVIFLGVVPSFVAFSAWAVVLSCMPAARAANFTYCVPPLSMAIAVPLLGELPSWLSLVGGLIVLGGVLAVNYRRSSARS